MIVISGVLVLVALVLLVIGVVGPDLTFVYASIGVSLVSLVFLVIGILQRRGETPTGDAEPAPAPDVTPQSADDVTTVVPAPRAGGRRTSEPAPVAATDGAADAPSGDVLVVEGRPRYHVDGCRYLSGKDAELVDVGQARDEGFTPCGVCKPDDALAAPAEQAAQEQPQDDEVEVEAPTAPAAAVRPTRKAATRVVKAPAKAAPSALGAAPAKKAPARTSAAKAPAKKAPSRAATAAAASTPAAATAAGKAGSVVVIPDRGKFHRADCRYVRDVDGAEVLSKTAATRQGYAACGVCKP